MTLDGIKRDLRARRDLTALYARALGKWLLLATAAGISCGLVGTAFHMAVEAVTELRGEFPRLLYGLPLAGLAIVGLYKLLGTEGQGTNDIFDQVHKGGSVSLLLVPAIFLGTVLTHLCGGSAGRDAQYRQSA